MSKAVQAVIHAQSFCTLATASGSGRPHVVGILYEAVDGHLYCATGSHTRKARNILANPRVAICIPVRKYPVGPPFCVQFQGRASILDPGDPEIVTLLGARKLRRITGFGVLKDANLCFVKVTPSHRMFTYGVGVPFLELMRDPIRASRAVDTSLGTNADAR